MNKYQFLILFFSIVFITINVNSQKINTTKDSIIPLKNNSYQYGKKYILGGITVTGLKKFNEQTVRLFTGLKNGQHIKLPGDKLTSAIKKLYQSKQFSDVDVYLSKIDEKTNTVYLQFDVVELPQLNELTILGISTSKQKNIKKETDLKKGVMVTDNLIVTSRNYLKKKFTDKGFLKTKVSLQLKKDSLNSNSVNMFVYIDKGKRVKIKNIIFKGNKILSSSKLRGVMKHTKRKFFGRFWKSSKYIQDKYKEDLESILTKYRRLGYRDARILDHKLTWNNDNTINLKINLEEGRQYHFGDILFVGNKHYTNKQLHKVLRIDKGDIYNGVILKERVYGNGKPNSEDIQTLYQNNGYLFSLVNAVETKIKNDSITVEVRIQEKEQATIKKVSVVGNNKTNDYVIYRELRVKPGDLFSKANIIRSIREIGQLGFFDTNITPNIKPNYQDKTADIEFTVIEKGGSQIQLQGGYGGGSFIGTLGLSFNNFSIKNIFKKDAYKPLPMGDGQKLSLQVQKSRTYSTYSFSFTEPWLGGKKPQALSFSIYTSNQYRLDKKYNVDKSQRLNILGISVGLRKRLQWPDDYFSLSQTISYQSLRLKNYPFFIGSSSEQLSNGTLNNLSYSIDFSRNSSGPSLIFPTYGSNFSIGGKFTFPYSLLNSKDYMKLDPGEKYKWLEYYKLTAKGKWYTAFTQKLVLMTNTEIGYLGTYNSKLGNSPFERYFVGGDGLSTSQLDGRETIGLRGYRNNSLSPLSGGTIYTKYQLELRYSITDKPSASIYTLGFLEAGNSYNDFKNFDPFKVKRSAGLGVRIFMPAFGVLGIDFGYGFDPLPGEITKSGWRTHFVIGRQF